MKSTWVCVDCYFGQIKHRKQETEKQLKEGAREAPLLLMEAPGSAMPRDLRAASQTWCFRSTAKAAVASLSPRQWYLALMAGLMGVDKLIWITHSLPCNVGLALLVPAVARTHRASPAGLVLLGAVHGSKVAVGWCVLEQIAEGAAHL